MAKRAGTAAQGAAAWDVTKFTHSAQVGGVESYVIDDGQGRGVRALCVDTGAGLRYRVLVDRGLDIDQAFFGRASLAYLTHKGVMRPSRGLDKGWDWLKGFPGGLLTSCGPTNIGSAGKDGEEELGGHGPHSNTAAELEEVTRPDVHAGRKEVVIRGTLRYGQLYGPCVTLRRTIRSVLGENRIEFVDEFANDGNEPTPHAWLLHINFGYPLVDAGAELCFDAAKVEPMGFGSHAQSAERFADVAKAKRVPAPSKEWAGTRSAVGYVYPRALGRDGQTTVGIVNPKLGIGVAVHYSTKEFPRCANWQHFGEREYVTALEPCNGGVEGRWVDRVRGWMDSIPAGGRKVYGYAIEVVSGREGVEGLRKLNGR